MSLKLQKRSSRKETDGVWANLGATSIGYVWWLDGEVRPIPKGPTARVLVARAGNQRSREHRRKATEPYKKLIRQMGEMPPEVLEKILIDTMANTILLSWENLSFGQHEGDVEYSIEMAKEALADEDFREVILDISGTAQNFRDESMSQEAEILGNASSGTSSGVPSSQDSTPPEA